jgi:hypothetical protein
VASRPALAQEEAAPVVATGTAGGALNRPLYFGLGVGGVFNIRGGAYGLFRIEEDIGYHVWSTGSHPGLFVGLLANQAFGKSGYGQRFDIDARVGFDINVYEWGSGALLVTPSMAMGVAIARVSILDPADPWGGSTISDTSAAFDLMILGELRAVFVDGLIGVWFRPMGLEITAASGGAGVMWDLNAGVLINI